MLLQLFILGLGIIFENILVLPNQVKYLLGELLHSSMDGFVVCALSPSNGPVVLKCKINLMAFPLLNGVVLWIK